MLQGDPAGGQASSEAAKVSAALDGMTRGWFLGQEYWRGNGFLCAARRLGASNYMYRPSASTCRPWYLSVHFTLFDDEAERRLVPQNQGREASACHSNVFFILLLHTHGFYSHFCGD